MRPAGEISKALLQAVEQLATVDRGVTLREIAAHAQVGLDAARSLIPKMKRHGRICICGERKVAGRNRPAAEYGLPRQQDAANDAVAGVFLLAQAWG